MMFFGVSLVMGNLHTRVHPFPPKLSKQCRGLRTGAATCELGYERNTGVTACACERCGIVYGNCSAVKLFIVS